MKRRNARLAWGILFLAPFFITAPMHLGCSASGGYEDARAKVAAGSIIVSPETLNGWLTNGYGTDSLGYNKLVVLDVSARADYAAGHIPGAFHVDAGTEVNVSRSDGIGGTYSYSYTDPVTTVTSTWTDINAPAQVATREIMDSIVQRTGIDRNTVVAIAGDSVMNISLAYFNFRYWGFPKERLRVLDRARSAWVAAGYSVSTDVPAPAPSTYSVCNLKQNTSLRASLADMIHVADGAVPNAVPWDVRADSEFNGDTWDGVATSTLGTKGPFAGKPGYVKRVAFEGHVKGAVHLNYVGLLTTDGKQLLDEGTVRTKVNDVGLLPNVQSFIYCRTGGRASVGFLAVDGMLGYPAKLYDASWMEWGQMAIPAKGGALTADSPWRTDNARTEPVNYTADSTGTTDSVDRISGASAYARRADMVTVTDATACGTSSDDNRPVTPGY